MPLKILTRAIIATHKKHVHLCMHCAVLCMTVVHNDTHTHELFLKMSVGLGLGSVAVCFFNLFN